MIAPKRFIELIREASDGDRRPIRVVWHVVESYGRSEFAQAVRECRGREVVIPLMPEGGRFVDPNSIATDFVWTLERNRANVEQELAGLTVLRESIVFALVSRRELTPVGGLSMVRLPDWFPHLGGREVEVAIRDSLRDLRVAKLDDVVAGVREVCGLLFDLDMALAKRIRRAVSESGRECADALQRLGLMGPGGSDGPWRTWDRRLSAVAESGSYRLDVREGSSPLALVVRLVAKSSPDSLLANERELERRLGLQGESVSSLPLIGLLYRSTGQRGAPGNAHGLFMSVFAAYNLVNAAAHADQYPRYSIGILSFAVRDIRRGLKMAVENLEAIDRRGEESKGHTPQLS